MFQEVHVDLSRAMPNEAADPAVNAETPVPGWYRVVFIRESNATPISRWSVDVWAEYQVAAIDAVCYSEQTVNGFGVQIVGAIRLDTLR